MSWHLFAGSVDVQLRVWVDAADAWNKVEITEMMLKPIMCCVDRDGWWGLWEEEDGVSGWDDQLGEAVHRPEGAVSSPGHLLSSSPHTSIILIMNVPAKTHLQLLFTGWSFAERFCSKRWLLKWSELRCLFSFLLCSGCIRSVWARWTSSCRRSWPVVHRSTWNL